MTAIDAVEWILTFELVYFTLTLITEWRALTNDDDDKSLKAIDIRRNDQIPMMEINPSSKKRNESNKQLQCDVSWRFFFRSSWFVCDNYRLADECKDHERYKYTHSDAFCMCVWHECNIQIDILLLSWRRTKNLNSGRRLQRDSEMSSLVITITCT